MAGRWLACFDFGMPGEVRRQGSGKYVLGSAPGARREEHWNGAYDGW
jgi:hypothetical protein